MRSQKFALKTLSLATSLVFFSISLGFAKQEIPQNHITAESHIDELTEPFKIAADGLLDFRRRIQELDGETAAIQAQVDRNPVLAAFGGRVEENPDRGFQLALADGLALSLAPMEGGAGDGITGVLGGLRGLSLDDGMSRRDFMRTAAAVTVASAASQAVPVLAQESKITVKDSSFVFFELAHAYLHRQHAQSSRDLDAGNSQAAPVVYVDGPQWTEVMAEMGSTNPTDAQVQWFTYVMNAVRLRAISQLKAAGHTGNLEVRRPGNLEGQRKLAPVMLEILNQLLIDYAQNRVESAGGLLLVPVLDDASYRRLALAKTYLKKQQETRRSPVFHAPLSYWKKALQDMGQENPTDEDARNLAGNVHEARRLATLQLRSKGVKDDLSIYTGNSEGRSRLASAALNIIDLSLLPPIVNSYNHRIAALVMDYLYLGVYGVPMPEAHEVIRIGRSQRLHLHLGTQKERDVYELLVLDERIRSERYRSYRHHVRPYSLVHELRQSPMNFRIILSSHNMNADPKDYLSSEVLERLAGEEVDPVEYLVAEFSEMMQRLLDTVQRYALAVNDVSISRGTEEDPILLQNQNTSTRTAAWRMLQMLLPRVNHYAQQAVSEPVAFSQGERDVMPIVEKYLRDTTKQNSRTYLAIIEGPHTKMTSEDRFWGPTLFREAKAYQREHRDEYPHLSTVTDNILSVLRKLRHRALLESRMGIEIKGPHEFTDEFDPQRLALLSTDPFLKRKLEIGERHGHVALFVAKEMLKVLEKASPTPAPPGDGVGTAQVLAGAQGDGLDTSSLARHIQNWRAADIAPSDIVWAQSIFEKHGIQPEAFGWVAVGDQSADLSALMPQGARLVAGIFGQDANEVAASVGLSVQGIPVVDLGTVSVDSRLSVSLARKALDRLGVSSSLMVSEFVWTDARDAAGTPIISVSAILTILMQPPGAILATLTDNKLAPELQLALAAMILGAA